MTLVSVAARRISERRLDGRIVLAALLVLYFAGLAAWEWHWPRFGVPGIRELPFADLRSVTTAWECARDGIDTVPENPCDPLGRPANYPSIWIVPAFLGLGEGSTFVLGLAVAAVFFASVFAVIGPVDLADVPLYAALLCSPAVMLGVERGNVDLLVFAVVVLGLMALHWEGPLSLVAGHALLLFAAVLKLFPVFVWGVFLRPPWWRAVAGIAALVAVFGAYALATLDDLREIWAVVPQEVRYSYGAGVFPAGSEIMPFEGDAGKLAVVAVGMALAVPLVILGRRRNGPTTHPGNDRDIDALWAGAGIFLGTFALFHNYNYRLAFLVLTVPQLLRWTRTRTPAVPFPSLGLTAVLLSLWLSTSLSFFPLGLGDLWERAESDLPYDELVNVALFAYLAAALVLTAPWPRRQGEAGR